MEAEVSREKKRAEIERYENELREKQLRAAIRIQRTWRGYKGRKTVETKRKAIAKAKAKKAKAEKEKGKGGIKPRSASPTKRAASQASVSSSSPKRAASAKK